MDHDTNALENIWYNDSNSINDSGSSEFSQYLCLNFIRGSNFKSHFFVIQIESLMAYLTCLGKAFRNFDMFPNNKFLRYNGQDQYRTTTGGIISAAVLLICALLFASMGFRTVTKQIITSSESVAKQLEPQQVVFTTSSGANLMFGLSFWQTNWTMANKLFNVTIIQDQYSTNYNLVSSNTTQMVQCTPEHFAYGSDLSSIYQKLWLKNAFCPPLNKQFKVKGKASSDVFNIFRVAVDRCDWTIDPNCYNATQFANYEATHGSFIVDIPIVQSSINAGNEVYKSMYFEDQNYFYFDSQLGVLGTFTIQQDKVETDVSILPYTSTQTELITSIPNPISKEQYLAGGYNRLVEIEFKKSSKTVTYNRSFNKLDTYFSYVGGLIGTILALVFIIGKYTEVAYEVSLSKKLFLNNDKQQLSSGTFNFFSYLKLMLKKMVNTLGCNPEWPKTQLFEDCCDQLGNQLDVTYVLRKLMFVDAIASKIFEDHELKVLYMRTKPTLDVVNEQRRRHFTLELFKQKKIQSQNSENPTEDNVISPKNLIQKEQIQMQSGEKEEEMEPKRNDQISNVSAIDLQHRDSDLIEIRQALEKVAKEGKEGKKLSNLLIEQVDPEILKMAGSLQRENRQGDNKSELMVESINSEQFYQTYNNLNKEKTQGLPTFK